MPTCRSPDKLSGIRSPTIVAMNIGDRLMKRRSFMVIIGAAVLALSMTHAQQREQAMTLTPQDYIDIEQLGARYVHAVDHCTNGGYDYADLYTDDGEFAVAEEWGAAPEERRFRTHGRDALAV